jgi:hypothetical protein
MTTSGSEKAPRSSREVRMPKPGRISFTPKFYESDCQGRFSSLLIAVLSSPLQSALPDRKRTIVSAYGWAEQSFALASSSVFSVDPH